MIGEHLESQFHMINQTSMLLLSNSTIRSALNTPSDEDPFVKIQKNITIDRELKNLLLFNYAWDNKLIKSVFIFEDKDHYYFISREPVTKSFKEKYLNIENYLLPPQMERHFIPPTENEQTIFLIRNINDLNTQNRIGILVLAIDVSVLSEVDHNFITYNHLQILSFDHEGIIYTHTDKQQLGKIIDQELTQLNTGKKIHEISIDNENYLAALSKIDSYQLNSIVAIPEKEVFSDLKGTMEKYLLSIIMIILLSLIAALYISSKVVAPLQLITSITEEVKKGNFHEKLPTSKYVELNQLSTVFNKMTDDIDHLINQVYEKQLLLKESELAMLQSQINPHFFFNVLETIGWEARFSNNDKIYKMINSLGQLMRAFITLNRREKITIREELQYIDYYLTLQKMRFEDKLQVSIHISKEELKDYYLPKLCILPIVENAIIHGLEKKRAGGHLVINITELEGKIYFEIIDNGTGFDVSDFNSHNNDIMEKRKNGRHSIGLYNSNARIQLIYGDAYGVSIDSKIGVGTKVMLCIPIDEGGIENVPCDDC